MEGSIRQADQDEAYSAPREVVHIHIDSVDVQVHPFSISAQAISCRVRLLDCQALVQDGVLHVLEFTDFPTVPYAAVSYTWRGISHATDSTLSHHVFSVEGSEEADPIGADALRHAVTVALMRGCSYLWMDRLCMVQTSPEDRNWHIMHMHRIYSSCSVCIVCPGGMQRLVRLDEETWWIHRSWTLMESLASPAVVVLFEWKLGSDSSDDSPLEEAVIGESATMPLMHLLDASAGYCALPTPSASQSETATIDLSIFGTHLGSRTTNDVPFWRRQHRLHNVIALRIAMRSVKADARAYAIWQSALMRTCARPVDSIFSIMGLLGVKLDPAAFHESDLRGATIALIRAIFDTQGCMAWLSAAFHVQPDSAFMPPLPTFPLASVAGPALTYVNGEFREASEGAIQLVDHWPSPMFSIPKGCVDQRGCLTFTARAVRLRSGDDDDVLACRTWDALDGSSWIPCPQLGADRVSVDSTPAVYGAILGWFRDYHPSLRLSSFNEDRVAVMVLKELRPGIFQLRPSFSFLSNGGETDASKEWREREFCVECGEPTAAEQPGYVDYRAIYDVSLESLATCGGLFSIAKSAARCHIRLVDCVALVEWGTVHVVEFAEFPRVPYSAVSCPWRGVDYGPTIETTFNVEGAEEADPISVDVVRQACMASLIRGCRYLWLDRLCIIQTDRADKDWHIRYMCRVFKSCAVCLVLSGGMSRLVCLHEETPWIYRSWTLLEAVASRTVLVLLSWELGWGKTATRRIEEHIREVIPGHSATVALYFLLERCVMGFLTFTPFSRSPGRATYHKVSLFGAWPVQDRAPYTPFWRLQHKLFAPHATALTTTLTVSRSPAAGEAYTNAVWQSALMRTASRPVDMIFSIMGLFGVVLDPSTFREDDLHGATLALIQAILAPRGRPSWLGAAFHLQFNEHIATFPTFPIASPAGPPRVRTMGREVEVSEVFGRPARLNGVMIPFPTCVIDDAGCLILTAGAIRLHAAFDVSAPGQLKFINAVDGSRWSMIPGEAGTESQAERDIYAVRIGLYGHEYDKVSVNTDPSLTIRIMLLEEHQPGLFHPRSYASLYVAELDFVLAWPDRTFCVGLSQTAKRTSAGNVICERIICDVPVDSLEVSDPLNVLEAAPTCRFRLIDCEALVERNTLRIIELPDIPTTPFTTISYPWRGVFVDSTYSGHRFSVAGALGADPIAISVLKHACTASLIHASHYLWVDTLCIIQTSEEDKIWQIRHMYSVYKSCALCLVVPGGLQRLVPLDEVTPWIHRSWTLQEAIAPPLVVVLFAWKLGWAVGDNMVTNQAGSIREVVPGQSAIAPLSLILNASTEGFLEIGPASSQEARSGILLTCCIFGQAPSGQTPGVRNAAGASDLRRGLLAPNAIALAMAMDSNLRDRGPDIRSHAVWQSALMRTSSRPVDMILSIMGVFGVSLDPAAFHKDDRRGAAIALAQAILKRGGSASWLGAACGVPPEKTLSTFPSFPHNTINGVAFIHVNGEALKVTDLVGTVVYPMDYAGLGSLPKGSMDDTGYLTFSARATPLRYLEATDFEDLCNASTGGRIVMALDGSRWALGTATDTDTPSLNYSQRSTQVFGALLGWTNEYYPGISPLTFDNIRVVVLEEHRSDHFHVRTFFYLRRNEVRSILAWPERTFTVGGPDTPNSIAETGSLQRVLPEPAISSPLHRRSSELLRLEEAASQRAHRALPQRVLERFCEDDLQRHHSEFYVWTGMNVPPEHHNWTLV